MQYLNGAIPQFLPHFFPGACLAVDYSFFFNVVNLNKWSIIHVIGYLLINKMKKYKNAECLHTSVNYAQYSIISRNIPTTLVSLATSNFENDNNDHHNYSTDESDDIKGPCCLRCLLGCSSLAKSIRILCLWGRTRYFSAHSAWFEIDACSIGNININTK